MIPYSKNVTLSRTTIYRWLNEFRNEKDTGVSLMGKERSDKDEFKNLTEEQKKALTRWRYDNPYRTLCDLKEELAEHTSTISDPLPSESTIGRFLNSIGLSKSVLLKGVSPTCKIRLAFEAEYPQQLWMADTKGPDVYVEDPDNPGITIVAKPIALIDDNSRYLTAVRYVIVENENVVMDMFCKAVLLFGIPEMLYLDWGKPVYGKKSSKSRLLNRMQYNSHFKRGREREGKNFIRRFLLSASFNQSRINEALY